MRIQGLLMCLTLLTLVVGCGPKRLQLSSTTETGKSTDSSVVLHLEAYSTYLDAPGVTAPSDFAYVGVNGQFQLTGEDGSATFRLVPGQYVVTFKMTGCWPGADTVDVKRGEVRTLRHRFVCANRPKE